MNPNIDSPAIPAPQVATPVAATVGPHLNALKHGLRSAALLLPGDDADELQRMRQELFDLYRPRTGNEVRCVEAMAGHEWCMERCRRWRGIYHGRLDALLRGEPDGAGGVHCERDPHRWHHSAMDCALEEGRLGRLQDRERRKLAELQKLRRQHLLAGLARAEENEALLAQERGESLFSGGDARSTAPGPSQDAPAEIGIWHAMPSYSGGNGKIRERAEAAPGQAAVPGGDPRPTVAERGGSVLPNAPLPGAFGKPPAPARSTAPGGGRFVPPEVRPAQRPPTFWPGERGGCGDTAVSSG